MPSVQVGNHCYATPAYAAGAACAEHVPSTKVDGGNVVSLSCAGVTEEGGMVMRTSVVPVGSSASAVVSDYTLIPEFQPCVEGELVQVALVILAAVLVAAVPSWGIWQIIKYLKWGRGDQT